MEGECIDFEAVPGHGLKCKVTGVEGYTGGAGRGNAKTFSRQPCVTMTTPLVGSNKESRIYQVSCLLHPFLYMCLMDTLTVSVGKCHLCLSSLTYNVTWGSVHP